MKISKAGGKDKSFYTFTIEAFGMAFTYMIFRKNPELLHIEASAGKYRAYVAIERKNEIRILINKMRRRWFIDELLREFDWFIKVRLVDIITNRKIYFIHSSTDCDWSHSRCRCVVNNWREFDRYIENAHDNAEGPQGFERITKDEYDEYKNSSRDLALEAYENGHPHSISFGDY